MSVSQRHRRRRASAHAAFASGGLAAFGLSHAVGTFVVESGRTINDARRTSESTYSSASRLPVLNFHHAGLASSARPWVGALAAGTALGATFALHRSRVRRRMRLMEEVFEGAELFSALDEETKDMLKNCPDGDGGFGELILGVPQEEDLDDIVDLLHEAFERYFGDNEKTEDAWGSLAPLVNIAATIAAPLAAPIEKKMVKNQVIYRFGENTEYQQLVKPTSRSSVAVVARSPKSGKILSYFELCVLPVDGRRPEEVSRDFKSEYGPFEAYIANFCTDPSCQRRGIGKVMMRVAETLVYKVWKCQWLYLHTDTYEPSRKFWLYNGYEGASKDREDGAMHMRKTLVKS